MFWGGPGPRHHRPPVRRTVYVSRPGRGVSSGVGCGSVLATMIAVIIILMVLFSLFSANDSRPNYQGTADIVSTVERDPLPSGSVNETGYYTDNLGWINSSTKLTSGMKTFYKETGVQPYLYLASEAEVSAAGSLENLATDLYDKLFTDEAHFLFAYTEDQNYEWEIWFVVGTQATSVVDTEAEEIVYQYFNRYYYDESLSDEEFFSKVFSDSAKLMMKHVTNGFDVAKVALLVGGGVAVVGIIIYGVNKSKKIKLEREKEQNEFTEKMMNVPLETFGEAQTDKELDELMKKYNENQSK